MRGSLKIIFGLAVLCGVVLLYTFLHQNRPASTTASTASSSSAATTLATRNDTAAVSQSEVPDRSATSPTSVTDFATGFRTSTNYHAFILATLMAAQAGDRDAAYYLAAAIAYCDETHRYFFERRGVVLSLQEAIDYRARQPGINMTEAIQRAYGRCHEVYEEPNPAWGTAATWMAKAADAGQPVAQLRTATAALLTIGSSGDSGAPRMGKPKEVLGVDDARRFARAAVASKDPEVLFEVGDALGMLRPDLPTDEVMKEMLVWKFAACLRGADCSSDAEWLFQMCQVDPNCRRDVGGLDYLRSSALSLELFDLESRAMALSTRIDQQPELAWRELGLGSGDP